MYIKKNLINIVSIIIICLSTLIYNSIFTTKAESKIFKIENIEISEPFTTNFNKEEIINKAFSFAFDELTSTIITTKDKAKIQNINLEKIKYLVESFEIKNESFLDKKYIANFNVNFNKRNTLNFFENKNIFPSLKKNKDFLTILIFIDNDNNQIFLYDDNPFYLNWNKNQEKYFLLNYILMDQDIEEIKIINENKDNIENYQFDQIIKKYDLTDYIVSIFFKSNKELRILSKFIFEQKLKIINRKYKNINLNEESNLDKLILKTKIELEDYWKINNLINTSIKLPINLQADPKNTSKVINFEKAMDNIDLIYDYYVTNLSSEYLNYKIIFNGSPKQFLNIMSERGISINIDNNIWKIK